MITRQEAYLVLTGLGSEFNSVTNILYKVNPETAEKTEITNYTDIDTKLAELQAEWDAQEYARNRAPLYPTIGDQLDLLWHAIDTGDWTAAKVKTTDFYTKLKKVKDDNPKPS